MPAQIRITTNFQQNLDSIRGFLLEHQAEAEFDGLITRLFDDVIPNLERFPKIGRDFLAGAPLSDEGKAKLHSLELRSGRNTEIREYVADEYVLLYAVRDPVVFLLAIRHHYQLSFDLRAHRL
jgi:plasmid stabilization system protein ParE